MSQRTIRGIGHQIAGQEVSWAGDCSWTGTPSFGTESGDFLVVPSATASHVVIPSVRVANDAVNGVAFNNDNAAFSSRMSLFLAKRAKPGHIDLDPILFPFKGGAHGVVASKDGFIAPVGPSGVLLLFPTDNERAFDARLAQRRDESFYAYRLITTGMTSGGVEVIAFAAREQGVMVFGNEGKGKVTEASGHNFGGQDIVSVCPLNHPKLPHGVAALSRECKIYLLHDVTQLTDVAALDSAEIGGTGYDLLAAQGHLFVLTSESLVTLADLVDEFAKGRPQGNRQKVSFTPTTGVAIYPAGERGIHLIDVSAVTEFPVSELIGASELPLISSHNSVEIRGNFLEIETRTHTAKLATKTSMLELAAA